jgi:4,5-dihydroxyphthalate decarboxylase
LRHDAERSRQEHQQVASKLKLTVACGDYEIVRALKDGVVEADDIDLVLLTDMGPRERHWRLARRDEFDVCERKTSAPISWRATRAMHELLNIEL